MWKILKFLLLYLAYQYVPLVLYKAGEVLINGRHDWMGELASGLTMQESVWLSLLGMVAYVLHLFLAGEVHGSSFRLSGGHAGLAWSVLLTISLIAPASFLAEYIHLPDHNADLFAAISTTLPGILLMVVIGPIFEEILFRGVILGHLYRLLEHRGSAIFLSASLFGIAHLNPAQILPAILIGMAFGWLYIRSGSLLPSCLGHVLNNLIAVLGIHFFPNQADHLSEWIGPAWTVAITVVSVGGIIISLKIIHKIYTKKLNEDI